VCSTAKLLPCGWWEGGRNRERERERERENRYKIYTSSDTSPVAYFL
jgi:hypothetical protein